MPEFQAAFNADFNIIENGQRDSDRHPSHKVAFNFTREEAVKAANYFMTLADRVDIDGTTCTKWNRETRSAEEFPGFTMWASLWGKSGKLAPKAPEVVPASKPATNCSIPF